jgi:CBS domain containing-hemolysin-like protein
VLDRLGHIPATDEVVSLGPWRATVEAVDRRSIKSVSIVAEAGEDSG